MVPLLDEVLSSSLLDEVAGRVISSSPSSSSRRARMAIYGTIKNWLERDGRGILIGAPRAARWGAATGLTRAFASRLATALHTNRLVGRTMPLA